MHRKIILYGASKTGKVALDYYGNEEVQYFCDSDVLKHGKEFCGKKVINLYELKEIANDYEIIITSNKYEAIGIELLTCGINKFDVFHHEQMHSYGWLLQVRQSIDLKEFFIPNRKNFGPYETVKFEESSKITICFIYFCYAYWNSNQTLYQSCVEDQRFRVQILFIASPLLDQKLEKDEGVEWYQEEEYDPLNENLDYIVFNIPDAQYSEKLQISYLQKRKSIKIVILHANILFFGAGKNVVKNYVAFPIYQEADYLFVHKNYYGLSNAVEMDNPKMDIIISKINNGTKDIDIGWKKKINGRKVILWNTTHSSFGGGMGEYLFSFHTWYKQILEIFKMNKNLFLIFRPHPHLFDELIANQICTKYEIDKFKEYFEQSDNLLWDDTKDYINAFNASDVLFSDWSGLLVTYLPTRKPIVFLEPEHVQEIVLDEELVQGFYRVSDDDELQEIVKIIVNDEDPLEEKRMQVMDDFIKYKDGKNGERIKEILLDEWIKVQ